MRMFGSKGAGPGELGKPEGVAIDGDRVYIAEYANHRVSIFNTEGHFLKSYGCKGETKAQFQYPRSVHVNKEMALSLSLLLILAMIKFTFSEHYRDRNMTACTHHL